MYLHIIKFPNYFKNDKENLLYDKKEVHLARDRERKRRRIAEETNEEYEERLARDRERKRRRKLEETNEEHEERLARDRERKRRRKLEETNEENEERLARDRERKRRRTLEETNEECEARLVVEEEARRDHVRKKYSLREAKETPNQMAARLSQKKSNMRRKRDSESIPTPDRKLLRQFRNTINNLENNLCGTCNERFPSIVLIGRDEEECRRCHTEKTEPKRFSAGNNMDPGGYQLVCIF